MTSIIVSIAAHRARIADLVGTRVIPLAPFGGGQAHAAAAVEADRSLLAAADLALLLPRPGPRRLLLLDGLPILGIRRCTHGERRQRQNHLHSRPPVKV